DEVIQGKEWRLSLAQIPPGRSEQDQEASVRFLFQGRDAWRVLPQHHFELTRGAVAASDLDDSRRRLCDLASLLKIRVLGHDRKPAFQRETPDCFIVRPRKPRLPDVQRSREYLGKERAQTRREILIEEL